MTDPDLKTLERNDLRIAGDLFMILLRQYIDRNELVLIDKKVFSTVSRPSILTDIRYGNPHKK